MSQFIRNLITRHSVPAERPESGRFAEPRLKSRFETESGIAATYPNLSETVPAAVSAAATSPAGGLGSPEYDSARGRGARPSHRPGAGPDSLTAAPGRQERVRETLDGMSQTLRMPVPETAREPARDGDADGSQPPPDGFLPHEWHHRIEEVLRRLDGARLRPAGRVSQRPSGRAIVASAAAAPTAMERLAGVAEPAPGIDPAAEPEAQGFEHRLGSAAFRRPGLMHTPGMEVEARSSLQDRLAAAGSPVAPEPVVNVTIGRIEIRSIRQPARESHETATKASRIMSLGDYLAKRDGSPS